MSNIISFLERVGQDAELRCAGKTGMAAALTAAQVDAEAFSAILNGDRDHLEQLLDARSNLVCAVFPAKDEPDQDEAPVPEEDEKPSSAAWRAVASAG